MGLYLRFGKRAFDLVAASLGLIFLSPVLAAVAMAARTTMGKPVLFRQRRPGLHGRIFALLKFRTMTDARGADGKPLPDADRLTRVGRFLRATSLDELPQLWNVVTGDMSLVGPRPLLPKYLPLYTERQARRHEVRPGITGWAQVNGRNALAWESKLELDVEYVDRRSLAFDAQILIRTAWMVLRRAGISKTGEATAPEFTGSPTEGDIR